MIGASERPGNLGGDTVRRLVKFGFPGPVWPVNRTAAAVAGLPGFSTVAGLPGVPHLAVLAVPAEALLEAVRECAAAGVRYGVAYAGGLGEAGGAGADLQRTLVALCRETGFTLCGPNCVGVINATMPATPTFSTALLEVDALRPGGISIVAQSGGIATTAFSLVQQAGFGCRHMVSSGNEAVVGYADYLYALARDEGTHVIAGYLEGTADSEKLIRALEEARLRRKPVVLIKAGATPASARAAQAHTGALVGEDRVIDAVLRELGVIRVFSIEELVDVSLLLAGNRRPDAVGEGGWRRHVRRGQRRPGGGPVRAIRTRYACPERRVRGAAPAAPHLGGDRGEPARPHPDHGLPRGVPGAPAQCPRRGRRRAGDPHDPVHRRVAGRQGGGDLGRHRGLRAPGGQTGLRQLALAAARHPGATGDRRDLLLPRPRPGCAGHRPARGTGRCGRAAPASQGSPGGRAHGLRLGSPRPPPVRPSRRAGGWLSPDSRGRGLAGGGGPSGPGRGGRTRGRRRPGLPGRPEGHQPQRHAPGGGGTARGRSSLGGGGGRRVWPPPGARPRDRSAARRDLRPANAPRRHRAAAGGVPRSHVRRHGVVRQRRGP